MQLLTTRAQSEGSLGLWDDAIRDDFAIHDIAVHKQGPLSFFAIGTLADGSLAQCRAGRYREGESNARQGYQSSVKAFGPRAGLTGGAAYSLASCLIGLGKLDEASALLQQIDVPAVAQLAGDPDWGAGVTLAEAEIAYRRHDFSTAKTQVQAVTPVFTRNDAEPYQKHALETLKAALDKALPRN
jgi:eukaryotic-like serine/threonine-protein kinase